MRRLLRPVRQDVIVQVGVQRDYLTRSETRCSNADSIIPHIRRLMAYARRLHVPVISCLDAYPMRNGKPLPVPVGWNGPGRLRDCVPGYGVMPDHVVIEGDNCLCVALDLLRKHHQAILVKQQPDPYSNPKLDRLLTEMPARRFVVCGAPLETAVRMLVLGLIRRRRRVILLHDACGYYKADDAAMTLRQLDVKGCKIVTTARYLEHVLRPRPRRLRRGSRSVA